MKCDLCGKDVTVWKEFIYNKKHMHICQDCYKEYYLDETKRSQVKPIPEVTPKITRSKTKGYIIEE